MKASRGPLRRFSQSAITRSPCWSFRYSSFRKVDQKRGCGGTRARESEGYPPRAPSDCLPDVGWSTRAVAAFQRQLGRHGPLGRTTGIAWNEISFDDRASLSAPLAPVVADQVGGDPVQVALGVVQLVPAGEQPGERLGCDLMSGVVVIDQPPDPARQPGIAGVEQVLCRSAVSGALRR